MRLAPSVLALPLAGVAILLSACNEPATSSRATTATVSEMPASLSGELTSQSAVNFNDGSRYQRFDLQLQADTLYRVTSAGALQQPTLMLLGEDNRPISGPRTGQLYAQPDADGIYRLAINGKTPSDFGPFRLEVETAATTNDGELQPGADVLGRLRVDNGGRGNRYTLQVADKGLYEIILRSDEFDTLLKLRGTGVNLTDDDGAGGTDSRLVAALEVGSYQLTASGIESDNAGVYSLAVEQRELPEGINLSEGAELEPGQDYTGMLVGQPQSYSLRVEQAGLLQLSMRSDDLDSLLELAGPGVNTRDDDSGGGHDALISVAVESGSYRVKAAQLNNAEGLFTLRADISEVSALGETIVPGETRVGRLLPGQPSTTRLQITEPGLYRLTLRSSAFDALLGLQGQGLEEQNDDSGGGSDAQLEVYLETGEYQLSNGSYADEGGGSFVLSVSSAP